jgi:hypothetical protein
MRRYRALIGQTQLADGANYPAASNHPPSRHAPRQDVEKLREDVDG